MVFKGISVLMDADGDLGQLYMMYLSVIGIVIALASVSLSYAGVCEGKNSEEMRQVGREFLFAGVEMTMALVIVWSWGEVRSWFAEAKWWWVEYVMWILFGSAQLFVMAALVAVHNGIEDLHKHLVPRTKV